MTYVPTSVHNEYHAADYARAGDTASHPDRGEWIIPCDAWCEWMPMPLHSDARPVERRECSIVRSCTDAEHIAVLRYTASGVLPYRRQTLRGTVAAARMQLGRAMGMSRNHAPELSAALLLIADCPTISDLRDLAPDVFSAWTTKADNSEIEGAWQSRMVALVVAEAEFGDGS